MKEIKFGGKDIRIPTSTEDAFEEVDVWFIVWKQTCKAIGQYIWTMIFSVLIWFFLMQYFWLKAFDSVGFEKTLILILCLFIVLINVGFSNLTKAVRGV